MHELVFVLVCVLASLCIELNSTARMSSVAVSIVSLPNKHSHRNAFGHFDLAPNNTTMPAAPSFALFVY